MFERVTPESVGIPSEAIEKYLRAINEQDLAMHGLMIIRSGKCALEAQWKPMSNDFPHRLYSCSKSFTSIAVGMALNEGLLSLDDHVVDYFPERLTDKEHPYLKEMTIRDVLRMATCWTGGSSYDADCPDWIATFFNDEISHVPGTVFNYCTAGTSMLCCVIKRVTGKQVTEYLRPVFDKLGIGNVQCVQFPDGQGNYYEWGGSGIIMPIEDFAAFADLILHYGSYNGEQLLPEDYIREATSFQIDNSLQSGSMNDSLGYGYQFWLTPENGFAFYGMGGQYALCFPDKDLLVVTTGYEELKGSARQVLFNGLWKILMPSIAEKPLAEDSSALQSLIDYAQTLTLPVAPGKNTSDVTKAIANTEYIFNTNSMGMKKCSFAFSDNECLWKYTNATGEHEIRFGFGQLSEQPFPEYYSDLLIDRKTVQYRCFASCGFTSRDTLRMEVHIADNYLGQLRINACFKGDTVTLHGVKHAEWFLDEYTGYASGKKITKGDKSK